MKKLLITGFAPFGGHALNPSWEAVCALPDRVGTWQLFKRRLPVLFEEAPRQALQAAEALDVQAVLSVGLAASRTGITPELVGINLRGADAADNGGYRPADTPIAPNGPAAYFSTLPARAMTEAIRQAGVPAWVSYSAGAYVCNDVLYSLLHRFAASPVRVGFVHVPCMQEQDPSGMPLEDLRRALCAAILCL